MTDSGLVLLSILNSLFVWGMQWMWLSRRWSHCCVYKILINADFLVSINVFVLFFFILLASGLPSYNDGTNVKPSKNEKRLLIFIWSKIVHEGESTQEKANQSFSIEMWGRIINKTLNIHTLKHSCSLATKHSHTCNLTHNPSVNISVETTRSPSVPAVLSHSNYV